MRNPDAPKPIEVGGVLLDPVTYQPIFDSRQQEAPTRLITGDEAVKMGLPPGAYNMGADGKVTAIGGGGTTINNNMGEGDTFYKELDKGQAAMFGGLLSEGQAAGTKLQQIDRLEGILATSPQGAEAAFKSALGEYGIQTEGLDLIQSANALINQVIPQQRQPGSGPMSDADLAMFKQSVPRLINTPEGNARIIQGMRAIAEYTAQQGEIAAAVANREMTPADGRRALQSLANPLDGWNDEAPERGGILPAAPETASVEQVGAMPAQIMPGTVEDGYRFKGGNPADPDSWEPIN